MADSPSEQTGKAIDKGAIENLAPILKSQYVAISAAYNKDLPTGQEPLAAARDDGSFDTYIISLAEEVTNGTTPRAKRLLKNLRDVAGTDKDAQTKLDALENFQNVRSAATEAVDQNTGPLMGSTFMNAISGFFQWMMSGFSGGFDGLKGIIAKLSVDGAKESFKENLAKRNISTTEGYGKDAVTMFSTMGDQQVGYIADPSTKPPEVPLDLSKTKIMGIMSSGKPVDFKSGDKAAASAAAKDHFSNVADNLIGSIPDNLKTGDIKSITDQAKAALIEKGSAAIEPYIKDGKPLDDAFKINVLKETLIDIKSKLAADPKNASAVTTLNGVLQKFNGATSFDAVKTGLKNDPALAAFSPMIDAMGNGIGSAKLAEIVARANPDKKDLQSKADELKKNGPADDGAISGASIRKTIADTIDTRVNPSIEAKQLRAVIDKNVNEAHWGPVPISWVGNFAMNDKMRDSMANFLHEEIGKSRDKLKAQIMDPKTKNIDIAQTKATVIADLSAAIDREAVEGGKIGNWNGDWPVVGSQKEYAKGLVKTSIDEMLSDPKVDLNKMLNDGLRVATEAEAKASVKSARDGMTSGQVSSATNIPTDQSALLASQNTPPKQKPPLQQGTKLPTGNSAGAA